MKVRILDRSNLDVGVLVDEARLYFMTNNDVRERRAPNDNKIAIPTSNLRLLSLSVSS